MRRFIAIPALSLCAALAAAPLRAGADAHYKVLGHEGAWEVGTGADAEGEAFCAVQHQGNGAGLILAIYPLGGDPSFELHAFKKNWQIPDQADLPTIFNFSDGNSWNADGQTINAGDPEVDYDIGISSMHDFLADFGQSKSLDIIFGNGAEPAWHETLAGSARAALALLKCATKLLDETGGAAPSPAPAPAPPPEGSGAITL